jgi:hypothetical protein
MHTAFCPEVGGGPKCDEFDDRLNQAIEDRVHAEAEALRERARQIEDEYGHLHGEVYKWEVHGARMLRRAAEAMDPYDNVPGTKIMVRKSDGKYVRP